MNPDKKKIIIFASGTKDGGGSGFENLVNATKNGILDAEILAVVSNHENGGVREKADRLGIKFVHFTEPRTAEKYREITEGADLVCLSGWLKLATGLDPRKTINIHPGPLPRFGGAGMYGHFVHEAVIEAYQNKEIDPKTGKPITHSAVSMHFVTEKYDEGPLFFSHQVEILPSDTAETLAKRVLAAEHKWQPTITNKVLHGQISWDGHNPSSIQGAIFD